MTDLQTRLLAYHDSLGNETSRKLIKDAMQANTSAAFREGALLEALKGALRGLELAVRAAVAQADFTPDEVDEIVRDHVTLKLGRAAIAQAEASQ